MCAVLSKSKQTEKKTLITSYFGFGMEKFDIRLIPEFDGSPTGPSVVEWLEKAERVCRLCKIKDPAMVIPLRLTKGAYAVYQQLGEDPTMEQITQALYGAFGTDPFVAWRQFSERRLGPGETVDVYMADLKKLATPFGGASDRILACAFLSGLPDEASRLLRASSRLTEIGLEELLARARNILKDDRELVSAAVDTLDSPTKGLRCYTCGGPNHFSRDCKSGTRRTPNYGARQVIRCHQCNKPGHIARNCPGNGQGEDAAALAPSPTRH